MPITPPTIFILMYHGTDETALDNNVGYVASKPSFDSDLLENEFLKYISSAALEVKASKRLTRRLYRIMVKENGSIMYFFYSITPFEVLLKDTSLEQTH